MQNWELIMIAIGLSADAFAVAICKGLSVEKLKSNHTLVTGLYFGGFQAFMPLLGYWLGSSFQSLITSIDHWIAFVLLGLIGLNMVKESREKSEKLNDSFSPTEMLPLAIATSIDALAVGITFAFLAENIFKMITLIGTITFVLSAIGVWLGNKFGGKYKAKAELFGGVVLIIMGLKILLEHLGIIA